MWAKACASPGSNYITPLSPTVNRHAHLQMCLAIPAEWPTSTYSSSASAVSTKPAKRPLMEWASSCATPGTCNPRGSLVTIKPTEGMSPKLQNMEATCSTSLRRTRPRSFPTSPRASLITKTTRTERADLRAMLRLIAPQTCKDTSKQTNHMLIEVAHNDSLPLM